MVIEEFLGFGIGGDKDLEAAVEEEAVDNVGADAAADGVGGIEEEEGDVVGVEVGGGGETGEAGTDDDDSCFGEWWGLERGGGGAGKLCGGLGIESEWFGRREKGGVSVREGECDCSHWCFDKVFGLARRL